ncbi:MAG: hypothetical protein PHI63_02615 [Patescibacteria group bacterium]|nr:hypothetical protein [Patescibacteria group bacterium]
MLKSIFLLVLTFVLVKLFFPELGEEVERLLMGLIEVVKTHLSNTPV